MKIRKNITISEVNLRQAQELMALRSFDDFSEFVSALIREERERRQGPIQFQPAAPAPVQKEFYPAPPVHDVTLNDDRPAPTTKHQINFATAAQKVKRLRRTKPSARTSPAPKP